MSILDVNIIDVSARDGGLVNDFHFSDVFMKSLYSMNAKAKIDYMEVGYRADKKMFGDEYGRWKFSSDDDILNLIGDTLTNMKISVMIDVGKCDYKNDFVKKVNSPVDMVRVATYYDTLKESIQIVEYLKNLGYTVSCNLMAVSTLENRQIELAVDEMCRSSVDVLCIVDSYGNLLPKRANEISTIYAEKAIRSGKCVGAHFHNNRQLAFSNTINSFENGACYLDGSVCGIGRGAGNTSLEQLILLLDSKEYKYKISEVLKFIDEFNVDGMMNQTSCGYSVPYLISGSLNLHPRNAIERNYRTYLELFKRLK